MDIETIRNYCLEKPGVTEAFPFDDKTIVFRLGDTAAKQGRIFALCANRNGPKNSVTAIPRRSNRGGI